MSGRIKMNAATQTPRRLYEAEKNLLLKLLIKKLEKLEQALKGQTSSSSDKNKPNGNQQILTRKPTRNKKSNQIIQIGPNCTELSEKMYGKVNFSSYQAATRDLCYTIFGREALATHTLSGRMGPGTVTQNKQAKEQLKPASVEDIVQHVQSLFAVEQGQVLRVIRQVCRNSTLAQKKKKKK